MTPEFSSQALEAKALARRNQTMRNTIRLYGILLGVATAATWVALYPNNPPEAKSKILLGIMIGLLIAKVYLFMRKEMLFPKTAACPKCGHSWEIKERGLSYITPKENMQIWGNCPGCGSVMADNLLRKP